MKGKMIPDWSKVDLSDTEGCGQFLEAVQAYMSKPMVAARDIQARLKDYPSVDIAAEVVHSLTQYHQVDDPDVGWTEVFDVIDFTGTRKNGFDLIDVADGLTFRAVKPGEKAEILKVSGEKVNVEFDLYGGALGWSRLWFDDEEYWKIEDVAREFRARWYADKAQAHYDLLSASRPDKDAGWEGRAMGRKKSVGDGYTINCACAGILGAAKKAGIEASANSTFVVVTPVQLMDRVRRALSRDGMNYNVELVVTTRLRNQALTAAETEQYLVCLPGRKLKSGNRMDLTVLAESDVLAYAETVAGWGRYGAIVGDVNQIRRCATR